MPNAVVLGVLNSVFDDLHVGPGDYLYCTREGRLHVFTNELVEVAQIELKPGENVCPVGSLSDKYMVALYEEHSLRLCGMGALELDQPMEASYFDNKVETGDFVVLGSQFERLNTETLLNKKYSRQLQSYGKCVLEVKQQADFDEAITAVNAGRLGEIHVLFENGEWVSSVDALKP